MSAPVMDNGKNNEIKQERNNGLRNSFMTVEVCNGQIAKRFN
jgi:hypothetical protein